MKYFPDKYNEMSFSTNNGEKIILIQAPNTENVQILRGFDDGTVSTEGGRKITADKFVMLLNLYNYIMEHDIQNDFINPNGNAREVF